MSGHVKSVSRMTLAAATALGLVLSHGEVAYAGGSESGWQPCGVNYMAAAKTRGSGTVKATVGSRAESVYSATIVTLYNDPQVWQDQSWAT